MASETQERTAYLYGVPIATSESTLTIVLNNDSQSDYSIHVDELKKGAAVLKISASVSWSLLSELCHNLGFILLPDVVDLSSVRIDTEWMRQIRHCGLDVSTIVKSDVTVRVDDENMILEGRWADVNTAISNIKDVVAETFYGAFSSLNHLSRQSEDLNGVGVESVSMASRQRSAAVTMEVDHDRTMMAVDRHQSPENSHPFTSSESWLEVDDHVWHYIAFRYPDMSKHWEQSLFVRQNSSGKVVAIAGQKQDVINFSEWYKKHDLALVKQRVVSTGSRIDVNHLKMLISSSEAVRFGVLVRLFDEDIECIGKENDIDDLISWLKVALHAFKQRQVSESGADINYSSRVNGSHLADNSASHENSPVASTGQVTDKKPVILSAGPESLTFKTAESQLKVEVLKGDLTRQRSEVIVNPANRYLVHAGGAARAIQDAAGHSLISECREYIRKHRELPTSEVMHTTSGNLPRPINYVIHACGPDARDFPDNKQCLRLLQRTFLNCFMHANDKLRVQSLALPAISSGAFSVPIDIVGAAAYNALTEFDSYISCSSLKKRHLNIINFVNIDKFVTESLIAVFTIHLRDDIQRLPSTNVSWANHISDTKPTSDDDDSFSGPKLLRQTSPRNRCSVCGKTDSGKTKFVDKQTCGHRCCAKCKLVPCNKCSGLLAPALAQSRKIAERPQTSPRDVDVRARNSSVNVSGSAAATSSSHTFRPRSNSLRGRSSRLSSKATATATDDVSSLQGSNGKREDGGQTADEFSHRPPRRRSTSLTRDNRERYSEKRNAEQCVICMDNMTDPKKLDCGHTFCSDCIDAAFTHAAKCPCCGRIFGRLKGNQLSGGTMIVRRSGEDLAGFTGAGSLIIMYDIPSGLQQENHPNPGKMFKGTRRIAFLPATAEGLEICNLLREAFDAGLIFTIGKSNTTGEDNVVIWNDIHHKTSKAGQYGYPDFTYLSRVRSELAAKGIGSTSTSVTGSGATAASVKPVTTTYPALSAGSTTMSPRHVAARSDYVFTPAAAASYAARHQTSTATDNDEHSTRFVTTSARRDNGASQYGTNASSYHYQSLPLRSSSYIMPVTTTSAARPLRAMSTVDRSRSGSATHAYPYSASITGSAAHTYPHTISNSASLSLHGSLPAGGQATCSSRRSGNGGFQSSGTYHSTSTAATQHSTGMSHTGVLNGNRRYH